MGTTKHPKPNRQSPRVTREYYCFLGFVKIGRFIYPKTIAFANMYGTKL